MINIFTDKDYDGPTVIWIPPRRNSVIFRVRTHVDHIFESNESFTIIAMLPPNNIDGYTCKTNVTIMDKSKLLILILATYTIYIVTSLHYAQQTFLKLRLIARA